MTKGSKSTGDSGNLKDAMIAVSDGVIGAGILVFLGVLLGNWLDAQFHASPLWVILCSLTGGGLGLARLVQKAINIGQQADKSAAKDTGSSGPTEE